MNESGCGYVPGDRQRFGLVLSFPVADNLVLTSYHREPFSRGLLWDESAVTDAGRGLVSDFDIRTPSVAVDAATLSGGNQQKVIVAREFSRPLRLLVLDQPTRGLDVGAIEFVHTAILAERDLGTAVLLISLELEEVLSLADRILVIYEGEIVAEYAAGEVDEETLGYRMTGGGGTKLTEEEPPRVGGTLTDDDTPKGGAPL